MYSFANQVNSVGRNNANTTQKLPIQQNYRLPAQDFVLFVGRPTPWCGKHHHAAFCGNGNWVHFFLELNHILTDRQINVSYVSTELAPPVSSACCWLNSYVGHTGPVQVVDRSCKHIDNSGQKNRSCKHINNSGQVFCHSSCVSTDTANDQCQRPFDQCSEVYTVL